jgi:hypothetical protein
MSTHVAFGGRFVFLACSFLLVLAGCSDGSRSSLAKAMPTAPSAITDSPSQGIIRSGTFALRPFPGREFAYRFRTENLEPTYRAMGRGRFPTFVDPEGSVIWVGEYLRYRAGQCSHTEAFNHVRTQINGLGLPAPCGQNEQPFPGREEALRFRRELEAVYQARGAGQADTVVDDEGDVIWTMEYYRYVLSGCSHTVTIQKILDQIAQRGVPPDCAAAVVVPPPGNSNQLTGTLNTENLPCVAPSSGNVTCRFVATAAGGQPSYQFSWRFINPANNEVVTGTANPISPALGCGFSSGVTTFNMQVSVTITDSGGSSITLAGFRQIARADGACST